MVLFSARATAPIPGLMVTDVALCTAQPIPQPGPGALEKATKTSMTGNPVDGGFEGAGEPAGVFGACCCVFGAPD